MKTRISFLLFVACSVFRGFAEDDAASSQLVVWGVTYPKNAAGDSHGVSQATNWSLLASKLTVPTAIAGGHWHGVALMSDGTAVEWGPDFTRQIMDQPTAAPTNGIVTIEGQVLSNVVAVSAGYGAMARYGYSLALLKTGTVVKWGGEEGLEVPPGLSNVVAISAGELHFLALLKDGTVRGFPFPAPPGLSNIVAIAAAPDRNGLDIVLRADGTVVQWDLGIQQKSEFPALSNVVAVAAGGYGNLALTQDGQVYDLPQHGADPRKPAASATAHASLGKVAAIAAGGLEFMALRTDGTVAVWDPISPYKSPLHAGGLDGLSNVIAIAAGQDFCIAIQTNSPRPITNTFQPWPKH
jgi:alpha-tubulin suppressor-like RCC1 family protein